MNYYIVLCAIYVAIASGWYFLLKKVYPNHVTTLHKLLLALPTLKFMQLFVYTVYSSQCPWREQITARYMLMCLVTVATIYQTIMVCILMSVSKGWFVHRQNLSQDALSTVTLFMGGIYLCYSAFYVSVSVENIRNVVLVCLDLLYVFLFVCLVRFSWATKQ